MKNCQKSLLAFIIFSCMTATSLFAQGEGKRFTVGAGIGYGLEVEEPAIQVRGRYEITDKWGAGLVINRYLLGIKGLSATDFNFEGYYTFASDEKYRVSAMAGLNIYRVKVDLGSFGSEAASETGLSLGANAHYFFKPNISGFAEVRYTLGDADQLFVGVGVAFHF